MHNVKRSLAPHCLWKSRHSSPQVWGDSPALSTWHLKNNIKHRQDHSHYQKADASPQSILSILQSSLTKELTLTNTAQRGSQTTWSNYAARKRYYCHIHLPLLAPGSTGKLSGGRNELMFTSRPLPTTAFWTWQALSFLICKKSE